MRQKRFTAYFYLLVVTIIWAIAAPVIKLTLVGVDPLTFLVYRFAISALVGLVFIAVTQTPLPKSRTSWIYFLLYSLMSTTLALGFLFLGLEGTTVLTLSALTLIGPLLVAWGGHVFFGEKLSRREKVGAAIAVLGTTLTMIEPLLEATTGLGSLMGNVFLGLYLLFDIAAILLLKKMMRDSISPEFVGNGSFVVGFVSAAVIVVALGGTANTISTVKSLSLPYHLGVIYMALLSGTAAYVLRAKALKTIKVEQTALFGYLTPVLSVPLAVLFLGETITPLFVVGAVVVVIGIVYAEFNLRFKSL